MSSIRKLKGTEKGVELLQQMGMEPKEIPNKTKSLEISEKEQVANYVEELMENGSFDSCSEEECTEIRQKFKLIFRKES